MSNNYRERQRRVLKYRSNGPKICEHDYEHLLFWVEKKQQQQQKKYEQTNKQINGIEDGWKEFTFAFLYFNSFDLEISQINNGFQSNSHNNNSKEENLKYMSFAHWTAKIWGKMITLSDTDTFSAANTNPTIQNDCGENSVHLCRRNESVRAGEKSIIETINSTKLEY